MRIVPTTRAGLALALWLAVLLLRPATAPAQQRIAVFSEPGTPVVATEVLIAAGPADEEPGAAGLAYLAARAVIEPIRPALDSLGAHLRVGAQKDALSFSLIASPDAWEAATRILLVALFHDPVDSLTVAREQRAIRAELAGREANPADAVAREADAAFFGTTHPWGRPTVGTPRSVERLSVSQVDRFLRAYMTPERTLAVVVGPVDPERAREHLSEFVQAQAALPLQVRERQPERSPTTRDYNTITTWISTTFPLPEEADEEAIRLLAHLTEEELAFGPSRRSVFNVRSEVIPRPGGGELRFQVVIPPHEAGQWADRIEETLRAVAEVRMPPEAWSARLRRYRGERLHQLNAPEERAQEAARRLLVYGQAPRVVPELDNLTPARLRSAVRSLGEPTVVFLGPFFDGDR